MRTISKLCSSDLCQMHNGYWESTLSSSVDPFLSLLSSSFFSFPSFQTTNAQRQRHRERNDCYTYIALKPWTWKQEACMSFFLLFAEEAVFKKRTHTQQNKARQDNSSSLSPLVSLCFIPDSSFVVHVWTQLCVREGGGWGGGRLFTILQGLLFPDASNGNFRGMLCTQHDDSCDGTDWLKRETKYSPLSCNFRGWSMSMFHLMIYGVLLLSFNSSWNIGGRVRKVRWMLCIVKTTYIWSLLSIKGSWYNAVSHDVDHDNVEFWSRTEDWQV